MPFLAVFVRPSNRITATAVGQHVLIRTAAASVHHLLVALGELDQRPRWLGSGVQRGWANFATRTFRRPYRHPLVAIQRRAVRPLAFDFQRCALGERRRKRAGEKNNLRVFGHFFNQAHDSYSRYNGTAYTCRNRSEVNTDANCYRLETVVRPANTRSLSNHFE